MPPSALSVSSYFGSIRNHLCVPKTWSVLVQRLNRVTSHDNDRAAHLPSETAGVAI